MAVNWGANPRKLAMATPLVSPTSFAALAGTLSFPPLFSVYWRTSDSKCVKSLPPNGRVVNLPRCPFFVGLGRLYAFFLNWRFKSRIERYIRNKLRKSSRSCLGISFHYFTTSEHSFTHDSLTSLSIRSVPACQR